MKRVVALMALALLAGCAQLRPAPAPTDTWTRWVCDSGAEVLWRFADASQEAVDVRLGGADQVYRLKPEPGASGALYSDGVLALHTKGDEGLVYWVATNDLIGRGCKAP
ncbi:lysozyme inhibitor [Pseudomonas sp. MAFF212428]|uniref:Lysozyme inhibitor n=1 Tax=Pseudomonas brassicae TaxID=2708063 RepID=A0A6B3NUT2_9PSED|nr:MliC family protein [Pseudomonas brassicae]NER61238.1 lysozyme inhibitor [Pseudomonas brassicae]NER64801.1 lysozyme inhibitor [Pseudomonas brassicae]